MNSSQAIVQSVFGNLLTYDLIECLNQLNDDSGLPLFENTKITKDNFSMEYIISKKILNERRQTSLDGFISGKYQVAIECKFTEQGIGTCSRSHLTENDPTYNKEYCNGNFIKRRGRKNRCSLSELNIKYWDYIPRLFKWKGDADLIPCPLYSNYQLVRNVLAACVKSDKNVSRKNGHGVMIYDERNPVFQSGGKGNLAFETTKSFLKDIKVLRKCSWQRITALLRKEKILPWLTQGLKEKYGI